jgi:hypothetical protein
MWGWCGFSCTIDVGLAWGPLQGGWSMHYGRAIVHRFLRQLPVYMVTLAVLGWVVPHFGHGPYWPTVLTAGAQWCVTSPLLYRPLALPYLDVCMCALICRHSRCLLQVEFPCLCPLPHPLRLRCPLFVQSGVCVDEPAAC